MADPVGIAGAIRDQARAMGFDAVGITSAVADPLWAERLSRFIAVGNHGDMGWLEERAAQRSDPRTLWPAARSVIMLGMNYGPADDPLRTLSHPDKATLSVYARNRDYHDIVKKKLKAIGRWLAGETACQLKVFVDTAPVMEKPLAARAGLGWQGKHTNLLSRIHGNWLFLGAIFTTLDLPSDTPEADHCGSCRACLDACPTDAFPAPYQLDARRCISYLTIEHKTMVPVEFRQPMGNRIYGCDDCLAVCPWNKFARTASEAGFHARVELDAPDLSDLVGLDEAGFRTVFSGSPIKRIGRDRFVRNVLMAIANSGDATYLTQVRPLLDDPAPLVRASAVWAMWCLATGDDVAAERDRRLPAEASEMVRSEWRRT